MRGADFLILSETEVKNLSVSKKQGCVTTEHNIWRWSRRHHAARFPQKSLRLFGRRRYSYFWISLKTSQSNHIINYA